MNDGLYDRLLGREARRHLLAADVATYGGAALALAGFARFVLSGDAARWDAVAMTGLGAGMILMPLFRKVSAGKDGVSLEPGSAGELLDRLKEDNRAVAAEAYDQLREQINALSDKVEASAPETADPLSAAIAALPPPLVTNDPQKGRFGGQEAANGRILTAAATPSHLKKDWCAVRLRIRSTDAARPLTGEAAFLVHDSFRPGLYRVTAQDGEAALDLLAWGAFTVGALCDGGATRLELDLADSPNVTAPADWRAR